MSQVDDVLEKIKKSPDSREFVVEGIMKDDDINNFERNGYNVRFIKGAGGKVMTHLQWKL